MRYYSEGVNFINSLDIDSDIYIKIISKIEASTGIKFKYYQKKFIKRRIKSRIQQLKLSSDSAYNRYLKIHPKEIDIFLDNFTINYSYFFRNYVVYENIIQQIEAFNLISKDTLKIWSCPCASGEEPYSIAMILEEKKKYKSDFPEYKIIASDINPRAIDNAIQGKYGKHALTETPNLYKRKYFTKVSSNPPKYQISNEIRNKVEFINEDITLGHAKPHKYHLIFCRNFIIYINRTYRKMLLNNLESLLHDQGLLVLGKTETINSRNGFRSIDSNNKYYMKKNSKLKPSQKNSGDISSYQSKYKISEVSMSYKNNKFPEEEEIRLEKLNRDIKKLKIDNNHSSFSKSGFPTKRESKKDISSKKNKKNKNKKHLIDNKTSKMINITRKPKNLEEIPQDPEAIKKLNLTESTKNSELSEEKEDFEDLRKKIEIELEYINKQRAQLHKQISTFQRKKERFKYEKNQYEQELRWFKKQKEKFAREKTQFEEKVRAFNNEKEKMKKQKNKQKTIPNIEKPIKKKAQKSHLKDYTLPLGKSIIINFNNNEQKIKSVSLYGIGSTYVLILYDDKNKVYAMSHVLFSTYKQKNKKKKPKKPSQYASYTVPYLIKKMLLKGASEKNIHAYVIGGAQIFKEERPSIKTTFEIFERELQYYKVHLVKKDIGGSLKRDIKFDLLKNQLSINNHEWMD
jgi:chemotaxis methyl-accepting protein methylase/chemotaxis receptor (MCP) glutamine deamidase CheD